MLSVLMKAQFVLTDCVKVCIHRGIFEIIVLSNLIVAFLILIVSIHWCLLVFLYLAQPCKETCNDKKTKCKTCKENQCNNEPVQKQCPVTCNKCKSNGNKPCKDTWGAKICKLLKEKCKKNACVQMNCSKTCKKCNK